LESDLFAEETAELQVKGVGATKDTRIACGIDLTDAQQFVEETSANH